MVCAMRYCICIIKNKSREPLTQSDVAWIVKYHNDMVKYDILLDTIDTAETKYGTIVTVEVDNRDGTKEQHYDKPIHSIIIEWYGMKGGAMIVS